MAAGTHPDLKIVVSEQVAELYDLPYTFDEHESTDKKKRSRGLRIHQFRALSDFVVMTPHRGGRRIVFVYPADRILPEAPHDSLSLAPFAINAPDKRRGARVAQNSTR